MNSAIEAFEREFAPWALKLPAADVAARRNGQLRANGWSVLYEFGSDAYGDYLDYYAALRGATDARVNDDWHARIYETGQVVAFPAVLEAYLYGRDPSQEELDRARAPVLESLAPADEAVADEPEADEPEADEAVADEPDTEIGTADTALWEDLREVVESQVAPPKVEKIEPPRRVMSETPAEIDSVLDAAFGVVEQKTASEKEAPASEEPEFIEQPAPAPPRRSVPGYDPFVELRTLEPKSARRAAPTGDDFRPYWQRYPGRSAGIAAGVAALLLITIMAMGHGGSKRPKGIAAADSTATDATPAATDTAPASGPAPTGAQPDAQATGTQGDAADTATAPAPAPTTANPSSSTESTVARPVGPGSIAPIVRAHPGT